MVAKRWRRSGVEFIAGLAVNLDPVAALRQPGQTDTLPDPAAAAVLAELGGASGISLSLRPYAGDKVTDRDARLLGQLVQSRFILSMPPTSEMVGTALDIKPSLLMLIADGFEPDKHHRALDLIVQRRIVTDAVATLRESGVPAGVCIKPDLDQIKLAHQLNADWVDIDAGLLTRPQAIGGHHPVFARVLEAAKLAHRLKMAVMISGGLNATAVNYLSGLKEIDYFHIGHGIVARAVLIGMERAVKEMVARIRGDMP